MPVALNLTKRQPVSQGLTSAKPPKHAGGGGGGGGETLGTRLTKHKKSYAYTGTGGKKLEGRLNIFRTFPKLPEPKTICEKRCIFLPICTNVMRAALPFNYTLKYNCSIFTCIQTARSKNIAAYASNSNHEWTNGYQNKRIWNFIKNENINYKVPTPIPSHWNNRQLRPSKMRKPMPLIILFR